MLLKEVDDVDVVLIFAERISCNASYFQPSVVKEVGHGVEERKVAADDPRVDILFTKLVTDDGDETETIDGDRHRLNQRDGNVVSSEFDDVSAALLQSQNCVDVSFAVVGSTEVVPAVQFFQQHDHPIGDDQRQRVSLTALLDDLQVDSFSCTEEAFSLKRHHRWVAPAQWFANHAEYQHPVEKNIPRILVDDGFAIGQVVFERHYELSDDFTRSRNRRHHRKPSTHRYRVEKAQQEDDRNADTVF